ncbi:hypothetical protein M885DRAFT_517765 [Pelagophyceae sp. CCMP2097]|nr:hypothetical protein M885DRAFT_517765 [Pelagophyceae sp. CCMP2097]
MHTYFETPPDDARSPAQRAALRRSLKVLRRSVASWEAAWQNAGFDTLVLNENDANIFPNFTALRKAYAAYPTVNRASVEVPCHSRYAAMAARGGGWMSDVDVFPALFAKDWPAAANKAHVTLYQRHVPGLVSGTARAFANAANDLANLPFKERTDIFTEQGRPHVSDMHGMLYLLQSKGAHAHPCQRVVPAKDVLGVGPSLHCDAFRPSAKCGGPRTLAAHCSHHDFYELRGKNASSVAVDASVLASTVDVFLQAATPLADIVEDCCLNATANGTNPARACRLAAAPQAAPRARPPNAHPMFPWLLLGVLCSLAAIWRRPYALY